MKNQFCSYEIALKLKELGFNEKCLGCFYNGEFYIGNSASDTKTYNDCDAPLWQQAISFFRTKYNLKIDVIDNSLEKRWAFLIGEVFSNKPIYGSGKWLNLKSNGVYYNTFEEAEERAILKAIEIVKNIKV